MTNILINNDNITKVYAILIDNSLAFFNIKKLIGNNITPNPNPYKSSIYICYKL